MPKQKNDNAPTPLKPEIPEPTTDAAGAESQAATTASDRVEDSAPAEPGTAAPTPLQGDTSEGVTTNNVADAESQVPVALSNTPEDKLPPIAEPTSEPAFCEYVVPFIAQDAVAPAPTPKSKTKPETPSYIAAWEKRCRPLYGGTTSIVAGSKTELPAPAENESTRDAEVTQPNEFLPAPVGTPLPPTRLATAVELHTWIKQSVLAQTCLPEDAAQFVAFWVISTYFQDALSILPCLVFTGTAYDAGTVLHVLGDFCRKAVLLAGFRRSNLGALRGSYETNLISEPNLDKRTANFLSSLTDRRFLVVEGGSLTRYSKSTAIYAGENPEPHRIQNSIHIHIAPSNAARSAPRQWLQEMIARIPVLLDRYRTNNLSYIPQWKWVPSGLSFESATIATALGRGIVDAPELRQKLVVLLKSQDRQRLAEMSITPEAIVLEATRILSRDGREHAYAGEIAAQANRLLEVRGETARLSPETVGRLLRKLGLPTRRLQTGNSLTFDKATVAKIERLAAMYLMEETPAETENLHGSQATDNN